MAIIIVTKTEKNQNNPYLFNDYFKDYKENCGDSFSEIDYRLIINTFFLFVKQHLLNGKIVNLPIGKFQIKEKIFNTAKQHISFALTNKLRKQYNDNSIIGYRDLTIPLYEVKCMLKQYFYDKNFKFKPFKSFYTQIPNYFPKK